MILVLENEDEGKPRTRTARWTSLSTKRARGVQTHIDREQEHMTAIGEAGRLLRSQSI
jgi:hypothetical protein